MIGRLQIGHIRARTSQLNRDAVTSARLRVSSALASADLRPASLPPSAILIVRTLRDHEPGKLLAKGALPRARDSWVRRTRGGLDRMTRIAARPRNGYIPADAAAVVFSDESELLAALVADLAAGRATGRWWWQSLLQRNPQWRFDPLRVLQDNVERIPPVFAVLADWSLLDSLLEGIEAADCSRLVRQLASAYELSIPSGLTLPIATSRNPAATATERTPPWATIIRGSDRPGLDPVSESLMGLALTIHHRPTLARSPAFYRSLDLWLRSWMRDRADGSQGPARPEAPAPERSATRDKEGTVSVSAAAPSSDFQHDPVNEPMSSRARSETRMSDVVPPANDSAPRKPAETHPVLQTESTLQRSTPVAVTTETAGDKAYEEAPHLSGATTALGGAFYLVNVLQRLGLPRVLERDWALESRPGPWAILDLVLRGLLGPEADTADPVFRLLAHLAGYDPREGPQAILTQPVHWEAPSEWLRDGPSAEWSTIQRPGQTLAQDKATGLILFASARSDHSDRWRFYRDQNRLSTTVDEWTLEPSLDMTSMDGVELLTACLVPWIRRALSDWLGVDAGKVNDVMLYRDAELFLTPGHLDVRMSINAISNRVRLSGLDRNPGWLPAWGRVIKFHFD